MPDTFKPSIVSDVAGLTKSEERKKDQRDKSQTESLHRQTLFLGGILAFVRKQNKLTEAQIKVDFNRTKDREQRKVFGNIQDILKNIQKNTKPEEEKLPFFKLLLFFIGSMFLKAIVQFGKLIKGISRFIISPLRKFFATIFGKLRETRVGRFLTRIVDDVGNFVKKIATLTRESLIGRIFTRLFGIVKAITRLTSPLTPVIKIVSRIAVFVKNFFQMLSKFSGVGALLSKVSPLFKLLGKIFLPLTIMFSIIDGLRGFFKAADIFGKDAKDLNIGEKFSAVLGGIVRGLTFGLIGDIKGISKAIFNTFSDTFGKLFNSNSSLARKAFEVVKLSLFGVPIFIFNLIKNIFKENPDSPISRGIKFVGNWLMNIVKNIRDFFIELPGRVIGLFSLDMLSGIFDKAKEFGMNALSFLFSPIKTMFESFDLSELVERVKGFGSKLLTKVVDGLKSLFTINLDRIGSDTSLGKFLTNIGNLGSKLVDGVKGFIKKIISGVADMVSLLGTAGARAGKAVIGFFSDIFKTQPEVRTKQTEIIERKFVQTKEGDFQPVTKARKVEDRENDQGIIIREGVNDAERMKNLFDFLLNQFSDTMAKKIGTVLDKKPLTGIETPQVRVL